MEILNIIGHGRGERVMAGIPAVHFAVEAEERKFNHPQEIELGRVNGELALRIQSARFTAAVGSEREVQAENQRTGLDVVRQLAVAVVVDR